MARIPTIQIPQVQRAPYPGATMDMNAAMAPLEGTMAIARGVGQIGQVAGEFSLKLARAREEATLSDNARKLNEGWGAFQQEIATEPDPTRWPTMFQKYADEAKKSSDKDAARLGPDGKARLSEQVANWTSENMVRVNTQSKLGEVKEQKAKFINAAISYAQMGDVDKAQGEITKAWQAGTLSDAEAEEAMDKMTEVGDHAKANAAILADPKQALQDIEDGKFNTLTPDAKLRFKNTARVQIEHNRELKVRELDEGVLEVQDGKGDPVATEKKIREALENDEILASQGRMLLKRLAGTSRPENEAAIAAGLWEEADKLERGDPELRMKVSQIRQASLSLDPHLRQDIDRSLDAISKPPTATENRPSEALATLDALKSSGVFGVDNISRPPTQIQTETQTDWIKRTPLGYLMGWGETREIPMFDAQGRPIEKLDEMGRPIIDEPRRAQQLAEYEQTQIFAAEVKRKLLNWASAHPEATPEDHHKKLKEFIRERADVSNASKVFNGITGSSN